jgi:hypothetical protein
MILLMLSRYAQPNIRINYTFGTSNVIDVLQYVSSTAGPYSAHNVPLLAGATINPCFLSVLQNTLQDTLGVYFGHCVGLQAYDDVMLVQNASVDSAPFADEIMNPTARREHGSPSGRLVPVANSEALQESRARSPVPKTICHSCCLYLAWLKICRGCNAPGESG